MFPRSTAVLGAAALLALSANAHQRVYSPEVVYTVADRGTNWGPQAKLEKQGFKTTADFNAYLKANNYKNLRAFMDKPGVYTPNKGATFECGYTDPNAPVQPIPKNGEFRTSGYTHEGPCEIWIDDVMVKHGDNCHFDISENAFTDKIDYSACKGKCMLKWYWLGIRPMGKTYSWQIYKACIPLSGNGSSAANSTTTKAPAATTAAPGDETGNDDDSKTPKPIATQPPVTPKPSTPAATPTVAPAPTTEKPVAGEASAKPSKGKGCRRLLD